MSSNKPTVAVIGASTDRSKFGNKSVRAHLRAGYEVYPINLHASEIEGLPAFANIRDIPTQPVDRVTMYLHPEAAAAVMADIAAVGCQELFLNPGSDGPQAIEAAEAAGLEPIRACSIVDVGESPASFGA